MARRKLLKNITQGLLNSFVSRNNDVYGYWGIGKLFSLMIEKNQNLVEIDLLNNNISPYKPEFEFLIEEYKNRLINQIENVGLKLSYVQKAKIELIRKDEKIITSSKLYGLLECTFLVIDDLNKSYSFKKEVSCKMHDPKVEIKSARKYDD